RNGKGVAIADAAAADAGVQATVSGAGTTSVQVQLTGKAETIALPNGSYVLTDPDASSTVAVTAGGPARISALLNGFPVDIVVAAGGSISYTDTLGPTGALTGFRIDAVSGGVTLNGAAVTTPAALVGPPATADACRSKGWQTFTFPT